MDISHNLAEHRFQTEVDGVLAYVEYVPVAGGFTITHTIVPKAIGGRGIAGALVKAALEYAQTQNFKVVPECEYADVWMKRHPEFDALRA
ncbi:MAG: N-acetyltransferase [Thermomonas sp.]|uniref:GNAT family N-acetyltransferase n=1 Tax=Thermomonas sp. TaxID=1971895 RepID=UPI001EC6A8BD|nr:GNAT family N-acetyltransferase [Thermomonas sp.]MBV2209065.1 N-acetyltransferase [Thermomonas sp.]